MQDDWTDNDLTLEKILEKIRRHNTLKTDTGSVEHDTAAVDTSDFEHINVFSSPDRSKLLIHVSLVGILNDTVEASLVADDTIRIKGSSGACEINLPDDFECIHHSFGSDLDISLRVQKGFKLKDLTLYSDGKYLSVYFEKALVDTNPDGSIRIPIIVE